MRTYCQNKKFFKLWCTRQWTLEGRITVFKYLALSKVIHLLLNSITIQFIFCIKYKTNLFGKGKRQKIKLSTLCNGYEKSSIKNVYLRNKITSIQCSWVKRLFENDFHDWKVIALFLIGKHLGQNFKFHNNIDILLKFPPFYQNIFIKWINSFISKSTLPSKILSEVIWLCGWQ